MIALLPLLAPDILPTNPRIVTVGRFDVSVPDTLACAWPACEVRLRAKGTVLGISVDESGNDGWQVVVDGKPTEVLALHPGVDSYTVDLGADAIHDVSLVKRTEALVGTTRFLGFELPLGGLFQARRKAKTIEFVGDSITAAFGIEGASEREGFRPETENAYLSYASQTARALDAEVRILAWSGRKMWPDNTMPEIVDRVLPAQPAPLADPDEPAPDAVVINLGTNDFAPNNPDEGAWTGAYEAFVRRIWARRPETPIYVALGSMMSDTHPAGHSALSTARRYLSRMVERVRDPRLRFIEFEAQRVEDGLGSGFHPNLVTHRKMAQRLTEAMRRDLKW